jgi:hypothetical protein
MNKVLIIAYAFPPVGGAGCQRPVKFVKYLKETGWEPMVLTVENPSVPLIDESLMQDIPAETKIYRACSLEPSYAVKNVLAGKQPGRSGFKTFIKKIVTSFMLPDVHILWWPGLIRELRTILLTEKPSCLLVTAPPFSSFIPVVIMGKLFRVPVVLDFRDEWSFSRQQWENAVKTSLAVRIDRILEKFVLSKCHDFIAVSPSYVNDLNKMYPDACRGKGRVITNGYDEDDFRGAAGPTTNNDYVTFVYAGTVWNGNSLENFASALKNLMVDRPDLAEKMRVKIFGRVVDQHREYLQRPLFSHLIELHGYMSHDRILHEIRNADVLLLSVSSLPGAEKIIVGKAFEYLATGRHIFAMVPEGETRRILQENSSNLTIVEAGSPDDIMAKLLWIMTNKEHILTTVQPEIAHFSRRRLTMQLASVLDATLHS